MFSDQGKLTYDPYDAFSLVPLSTNYLILYTVAGESQPAMQIQNLPDTGFSEPFTLPLYVGGTVGGQPLNGSFTLSWKLNGRLPAGWNITLMDDAAGKGIHLDLRWRVDIPVQYANRLAVFKQQFLGKELGHCIRTANRLPALPWPVVQTVPSAKLSNDCLRYAPFPSGGLSEQ